MNLYNSAYTAELKNKAAEHVDKAKMAAMMATPALLGAGVIAGKAAETVTGQEEVMAPVAFAPVSVAIGYVAANAVLATISNVRASREER